MDVRTKYFVKMNNSNTKKAIITEQLKSKERREGICWLTYTHTYMPVS